MESYSVEREMKGREFWRMSRVQFHDSHIQIKVSSGFHPYRQGGRGVVERKMNNWISRKNISYVMSERRVPHGLKGLNSKLSLITNENRFCYKLLNLKLFYANTSIFTLSYAWWRTVWGIIVIVLATIFFRNI